jgi:1,4-dihydroxy-2-naphthoate polyprenyltransferase
MTLRQFLAVVEIRTKIVSVSTYLLAGLYVVFRTGRLEPVRAVLMFLATLLVDMGTTAFNTYFDFRKGVDDPAFNREEGKVVVHEGVPWGQALLVSVGLFALAVPFGLALAFLSGWPVAAAGAGCMAIGYFYNGGRRPLSGTPFGELFAGGALGSALFLIVWYVQAGSLDVAVFVASLPSLFAVASILTVNNTCDIVGDRAAGRRTLSVVLGRRAGETIAASEAAVGFLLLAVPGVVGPVPAWSPLVIVPFFVFAIREFLVMHRRGFSHETKERSMGGISRIFLAFTAAMAAMLVVGIAFSAFGA